MIMGLGCRAYSERTPSDFFFSPPASRVFGVTVMGLGCRVCSETRLRVEGVGYMGL